MSNSDIEAFIHWAEADRSRSPYTIERYRSALAQLEDPVNETIHTIQAWWESRYSMSPATRQNELACLRSFYKWCMKFDLRDTDPTRRLDYPAIPNQIPRPIPKSETERILGKMTADNLIIRRAVALGVYGGLRVSEAAALDWANIDMESRRMYIRGKGAKERVNAIGATLQDLIMPNTGGNVVTAGGQRISGPVLQRKINRFLQANGIDNTFHDLRKRGATMAMARVKNPQAVAQYFGWSSLQTATKYAIVGDEVLDEIAEAMG